jgi:nitrilase
MAADSSIDPASVCRVAALQMCSGDNLQQNLERSAALLSDAASRGCQLAVLPENFAFFGIRDTDKLSIAEDEDGGPIQEFIAGCARRHKLAVVAGSPPLRSDDQRHCYGASMLIDADGRRMATYRKIHLFDVDVPGRDEHYRESATLLPGADVVTVPSSAGVIGLTICYDLRFPELYRRLADAGATVFTVPAAFTEATGRAHWRTLLRARAIENLAWVLAAGQVGRHTTGRRTWGHSMIVDPWGRVVAERVEGEGLVIADVDLTQVQTLRREFPVLGHRRL